MDKKQLTGLILISTILITYNYFFAPKLPIPGAEIKTETQASIENNESPSPIEIENTTDLNQNINEIQIPIQDFSLENDNLKITFTSQGGNIKEVTLKNYKDQKNAPIILLDEKTSKINYSLLLENGEIIETKNLQFTKENNEEDENPQSLSFTANTKSGKTIQFHFTLDKEGYTLHHDWTITENGNVTPCKNATITWHDDIRRVEKDVTACRAKTNISYYSINKKFDHLKDGSSKKEELTFENPIKWIAIKQRFFTAAIIANDQFDGGDIKLSPAQNTEETIKSASVTLNISSQSGKNSFKFYFGPNDYRLLKHVTTDFGKILPLGWPIVRWINTLIVIPVFDFLQNYFTNFGIIIILLIFFIKILILPISYKAYISTAKIKILKPAIDELKEKFGDDMHKLQMEQMKLYKEVGANPLGGIGLALLQMPILLAMFNFIPNEIGFRQKAFMDALLPWASDLSTYDILVNLPFCIPVYGDHVSLFTLLMTVSTILHTLSNTEVKSQQGPVKILAYTLPITFMFALNSFPAALSFYYFISNLVTLGIQAIIKKFVDEEKIKHQLEENRKKIKAKVNSSGLRSRLDILLGQKKDR